MSSTKRAVLTLLADCTSRGNHVACFCSASAENKFRGVATPAAKSSRERGAADDMEEAATDVADMARAGVVGAMETGLKLGEMAKQAVDATWDVTKATAESVRNSVADGGDNDESRSDYRSDGGGQPSDKHLEDLKRTARGCHLKD